MKPELHCQVFLAAEGTSDLRRIKTIVQHLINRQVSAEYQPPNVEIKGINGHDFIKISSIPRLARAEGLDFRSSGLGDGANLRKLLQILKKRGLLANSAVIWARDDDGDTTRLSDAKNECARWEKRNVILAVSSECGEAWVLSGWRPDAKDPKLSHWRTQLGFEPHQKPWRLSHKEHVAKSAKKVLEDILMGDPELEAEALVAATDPHCAAAVETGLRAFCDELEHWFASIRASGHGG